jgi:NADP-dependent 3-hydroxy acid dehydrogenase YdfG
MDLLQCIDTIVYFLYYVWCYTFYVVKGYPKPAKVYVPSHRSAIFILAAAKGVGAHAALTFVQQGYLVFAGVREEMEGERLKRHALNVRASGILIPVMLDVTQTDTIDSAVSHIQATMEVYNAKLVLLFNNAGYCLCIPLEVSLPEACQNMYQVNVISVVNITNKFLPMLRESEGRIVNMSGIAGYTPVPGMGLLTGSKQALEAVSNVYRQELKSWNIPIIMLEPGKASCHLRTIANG